MDEDKKYPITGAVTISTDEYRDLIQGLYEAKSEYSRKNHDWYEERQKAEKLTLEVASLRTVNDEYRAFFESSPEAKAMYKAYLAEEALRKVTEKREV